MSPWRLALLNLLRRRLPTLVALLALALPIATGGLLLRLHALSAARLNSLDQSFDAVIGAKAGELDLLFGALAGDGELPEGITENLYVTLRDRTAQGPEVSPFLRQIVPLTVYAKYQGHRVVGSDANFWPGIALRSGAVPQDPGEVVISEDLANEAHLALGAELSAKPWVSRQPSRNEALPAVSLRVVGIRPHTGLFWDQIVVGTTAQAQAVTAGLLPFGELNSAWREHIVDYLLVHCAQPGCTALTDLINHATVAQLVPVKKTVEHLQALTAESRQLALLVSALILGLGALAVAGIMVTRFDALFAQLTVLRALGYGRGALAACLATEGLVLAGAAVLLGAGLDAALFPWLQGVAQVAPEAASTMSLPVWHSLPVWLAAALAVSIGACVPLLVLYRQDAHRSLRS